MLAQFDILIKKSLNKYYNKSLDINQPKKYVL